MRHMRDFEFLEGVVRAGSIRKAAEDMNITASALNRRINRFEEIQAFRRQGVEFNNSDMYEGSTVTSALLNDVLNDVLA